MDGEETDKLMEPRSFPESERKIRINISREKICEEEERGLSKSSSRSSMVSKCSDERHLNDCHETGDLLYTPVNTIKSSSTEQLTEKQSNPSRWSGIEVNPLYDAHHHKRRKSLSSRLFRQMSFGSNDKSPSIFPKRMSRKMEDGSQGGGLDDPDGILVTKSEFLEKWSSVPEQITEPYNHDTEENVIHYLAREGKLEVLRDLFSQLKDTPYFYQAMKAKDRFGQTPMLSAINSPENRNEIMKFFLKMILEHNSDETLQEIAVFHSNKHNDTILTLLMKNNEVFRETMGLFFTVFCQYFNKRNARSQGLYRIICQILQPNSCEANAKSISDIIQQLSLVDPTFFQEENHLFSYKNPKTKSNVLMELAKNAKDDALREILVNRQTYRHVTHRVLQERNLEGQTLLAIIEVNRVNLAESLPIVLKKEYGCHRRDILKTEQCLARQLESSMSASQIIMELNDLENSNSFSRRSKIWLTLFVAWLCPSIGSTVVDIFFDSLLAIQYYHQYNNISYVNKSIEKCEECQQVFKSPAFNTTRSTIHCFEYCFSTEARLGYTLTFLLLPIIFYLIEFLTLTDRYEVTTLRAKLKRSLRDIYKNCCSLKFISAIFKFISWLIITIFVVIFWQPITAFFKFYRDGVYESSTGNERVDARIRKRQSDLTASRGQLIEVNVESAFEPIVQGYIIFPNIIDIAEKVGKMVTFKANGKVEVSLEFTTVETAQLFSITTSIVSLAWNYSEYQSVKKNMLLDVTVSPFSRAIMFMYMIMHIVARLLAFQLFALFWGPGQLYPLVIFVVIHMVISSVVHIFFSEDLYYVRKGKYLKFIHNTLMNAFATIYFHNYLRMDEMPRIRPRQKDTEGGSEDNYDKDVGDAQTPGLHISTFTRQLAFDILYFIEFVVLLGCGFSSKIVKDGYLSLYTYEFVWVVLIMTILALILKFFYYNVLHIWRNTIFTTTRLRSQPFTNSSKYEMDAEQSDYRFVEYVFVSSNAWFLGKLKSIKTTIMILPASLLTMIEGQGKQLEMGISNPIEAAKGEFSAIEEWKIKLQNLLHWKTTLALLCFIPLVVLGILVPLAFILVFVTALVLSLPLMILLLLYNFFGNCRNMIDRNMVDNDEFMDKDIEDLPPEIDSIENPIFSCDPTLTLRKIQENLSENERLDLCSKPEMSVEELENITVLLLSLNPRRYKMRELNLNDSRLTDEKLRCLAPLIVRFRSVKIGGKQDYTKRGLEQLRLYMEKLNGGPTLVEDEQVQSIKCDKIMLRELEIKQSKSKKGVTDLTWVNEEVKGIEHEDQKTLMVNELANMIPYLKTLILDGFLRESAVKPMNTIIGRGRGEQFSQLWQRLNYVSHLELVSLRDCGITDKILLKCLTGLCNVRMLDLSGNHDISALGWRGLADTLGENKKTRLVNLVYQHGKNAIDQAIAEQLAEMFPSLVRLDLSLCHLTDEAARIFLAALSQSDPEFVPRLDRLDLSGCSFSEYAMTVFEECNKKRGADLIVFKTQDATQAGRERRSCCCC